MVLPVDPLRSVSEDFGIATVLPCDGAGTGAAVDFFVEVPVFAGVAAGALVVPAEFAGDAAGALVVLAEFAGSAAGALVVLPDF